MTEHEKPDLSSIEPIGPVPDVDDAAASGAPPAVGVQVDADRERDAEPRTSPETEEQLEQLRRG